MKTKIPKGLMSPEGERFFGTLLERIEGKLDLLIESFSSLDKRSDGLETRMNRAEGRLDEVELRLMDGK